MQLELITRLAALAMQKKYNKMVDKLPLDFYNKGQIRQGQPKKPDGKIQMITFDRFGRIDETFEKTLDRLVEELEETISIIDEELDREISWDYDLDLYEYLIDERFESDYTDSEEAVEYFRSLDREKRYLKKIQNNLCHIFDT